MKDLIKNVNCFMKCMHISISRNSFMLLLKVWLSDISYFAILQLEITVIGIPQLIISSTNKKMVFTLNFNI